MLVNWNSGASWACAEGDQGSCPRSDWMLGSAVSTIAAAPTAVVRHDSQSEGWVEFDVTDDVMAFLSGEASNFGWLIKRGDETTPGLVAYSTREGTRRPELHIKVH
jgi:hypothetical protein